MGFLDQIKTSSKTPSNGLKSSTSSSGGFLDKIVTSPQNSQPEATQPTKTPLGQGVSLSGPLGGMAQSTQAVPTASTPTIGPMKISVPSPKGDLITPKSVVKGVVNYEKDFLTGGADTIGGTVRNTILGLPKATPAVLQSMGQLSLRGSAAIASFLTAKPVTPEGQFQKDLYGTDKPISLESFGRETRLADPNQKSTGLMKKIDPAIGLVAGLVDAIPGGEEVRGLLGMTKNVRKIIAETDDVAKIAKLLKSEVPQMTEETASKFAQVFKFINNENDVNTAINRIGFEFNKVKPLNFSEDIHALPISMEQKNALQAVREGATTPDILKIVKTIDPKVFEAPVQAVTGGFLDQVQKNTATTPGNVPETKIPLNLETEAKKYKSAEEFIKNTKKGEDPITPEFVQKNIKRLNENGINVSSPNDIVTLYHGTNAKGMGGITKSSSLNPFSYLATDPNASKSFAFGKKGGVLEIKIPVSDIGWIQDSMAGSTGVTIQTPYKLVKGSDGIYRADRTPFMSKDELSNIWNTANKSSQPKIDENLIVQHNLSENNLLHADKLGGLPVPSLAISNKNFPLENFGDITLIGDKNLIDPAQKSNKVFNADAYSKRYPRVEYSISSDGYRYINELKKDVPKVKDYFTSEDTKMSTYAYDDIVGDFENRGRISLENRPILRQMYAMNKGVSRTATHNDIYNFIQKNNDDYQNFIDEIYKKLNPQERIFKGFTYSGRRIYKTANLENIVKDMRGVVKDSEGFHYGVPSLRASMAKQYRTLFSIQKDRSKIIPAQEMQQIKDDLNKEFDDLLSRNDIQDIDAFMYNLKDYLRGKVSYSELQQFPSTKGVDMTDFVNFANKLKTVPTEYFEVKPQRAVSLSEFKYAVVPNTISKKAEDLLISKGIKVEKYDKQNPKSRSETIKRVVDESKVAFKVQKRPLFNKEIYLSKDEIRKIIYKDINPRDLRLIFTDKLIEDIAEGAFIQDKRLGNIIKLYEENGKVSLLTALHETKHYFFSKLSPEVQKEALEIAKKEMGPLYKLQLEKLYKNEYKGPERTDLLLEEYVVDQWAKADATKGFGYKKSVFGKIFTALDNLLKRMVNTYNKVKARAEAIFKERGGSKGGYVNFGGEKPKKTPLGKSVGKVTIGGKEIDITKGGQMDIPVPAKVSEIEKDLIEKKIQLELKQELLENSPFKSKENRLMVDREGRIRELGDIKSKKLIRKVEDRMAESGVSDPAEFSAGVEKYFQDKQDIAKLKRDIVALESTGNFAEGQRKQVKDIVKDSKLLLQESGAPIKTSAEGLPIALSKRQKEIVANSPFKDVSPVRIPVVEGTYAEIKAIEKLASQAESYIHGTPLPQGMTFAEVLEKTVTPIENKIGWFDILVRTPDRVMEGIGLGQEAKDLRTAMDGYWKELPKNLEKISDWLNELGTKEASTRVFKYLDGQAVDLNPLEQKVANEIRSWLATWPDRLGLKQDQRITDYITRIFDNDKPQEFDEELAKIIQDKIPGSVYNPFTLKRLGARGYKEDLGLALDAYVKRSTRKAYMDPVLERIQSKTGSEAALSKLEESQFTYVQDYINNINMRPTKGDKRADNTIKKFFKFFGGEKGLKMVGQRPIATVSRGLRRTASRSMLGLNLGTALRNLSQGVNTYAVLGEKYTTIGYVNLFKQGAFDELKEEGVLNAGFIQDKILSSTAKFWEKTDKVLYSLIEVGELINRGSAYFGAKAKYISENRKIMDGVEVWKEGSSMRDAIDYAKGIVRKTQFSFDSVDTPVGLQGDFVKTVIQFLGYPIKQAEFLFELAKDKNYAGILRYILGGVLFTYTIGQLFDMKLKNLVPTVDLGWPPSIKIFTSLFDTITNAPDKFGNKNPLGKRLQNLGSTAFKTVVPGGTQINKTYQGLKAVKAGGSVDSAGRTQFKVGGTTLSNIRAAAFGKYAGKNAQDYFDKITPSERAYKNLLKYDDKKDFLTKLAKNDPDVAKGVIDILKKKAQGITEEDEKIKNMGVKNGQRAEAINKKLKKLKNNKEMKALLTDYVEKGILTEDVMVQLAELK